MKIAHLSDLHYCQEYLAEVDKCTTFAVDTAIAQDCRFAVLSGDSTDRRLDLHSPAVAALLAQVRRLADHCPVVILHGTASHEPAGTLDVFRTIGGAYPVYVADTMAQVAFKDGAFQEWDGTGVPDILFSVLPSVDRGTLMGAGMAETCLSIMQGWAALNDQARALGVPTVGISHGTVTGCRTESGVPMMGLDHEFTSGALFAAHCSAFMLGHIHEHQEWDHEGRKIAYPGSIGRLHFGELTDKGFLIWDVLADTASAEFVVTPAKRLIQIDCEGAPDMAALAALAAQAETEGASVRIRWSIDEEHRHTVDKAAITALFANAAQVKLEGHVNPIVRTRASGMNKAITLADKVRRWAEVTGTDPEPLVERLRTLECGTIHATMPTPTTTTDLEPF